MRDNACWHGPGSKCDENAHGDAPEVLNPLGRTGQDRDGPGRARKGGGLNRTRQGPFLLHKCVKVFRRAHHCLGFYVNVYISSF